jgi:site-specific DNA recombinase
MLRAAIYSRYSSDLQSDRSIEDQVALCTNFALKQNLTIVAVYDDRARSGSSIIGRDGLLRMMDAARDGQFDVLIVEALDRLSRDQEDLAGLFKRLTHVGIEIRAVHEGKADVIQVGIRGLVGALYLQDLQHKIRRGMAGLVREGRSAGGKAYGYQPQSGRPGELMIVPDEAAVVVRIFEEYAAGKPPRDIAGGLNDDSIKPPRGRYWAASTINGNRKRGNGILQNPIYDGRLIWNRVHMVKDPDTGRRVSRANPASEWQEKAVPGLRIVSADLFAAAAARRRRPAASVPVRRNARMLSGLLRCGVCGSGMSVKGKMGKVTRIVCTRAKEARSCENARPYALDHIESTVMDGLRARLKDRALLDHYIDCYNDECQRLFSGQGAERARKANRLAEATREYERTVDSLIKGILSQDDAAVRLPQLRAEKARLEEELAEIPEPPRVVALKPALIRRYLLTLERLENMARFGAEADDIKRAIRDLISTVTVLPPSGPGERPSLKIEGHLSSVIDEGRAKHIAVRGGRMVEGRALESNILRVRRMKRLMDLWLPPARLRHPLPDVRFRVITQGGSPVR